MALVATAFPISSANYTGTLAVSYDGYSIWAVTGSNPNYIVRLRASDGAYLKLDGTVGTLADATWDPGTQNAMWTMADPDGVHIWIQFNYNGGIGNTIRRLIRYVITTGVADFTYAAFEGAGISQETFNSVVTFDGTYFWVLALLGSTPGQPTALYRWPINVADTGGVARYAAFSSTTDQIAYDGTNLWFNGNAGLMKRSPSNPMVDLPLAHAVPRGNGSIATNGPILWSFQDSPSGGILRLRTSDGAYLKEDLTVTSVVSEATMPLLYGVGANGSILWDATTNSLWRTDPGTASVIEKYPYPATNTGREQAFNPIYYPVNSYQPMCSANGPIWVAARQSNIYSGAVLRISYEDVAQLAQFTTLEPPTIIGINLIAQFANLWANGSPCPPTLEFVNQYPNHPPLSLFGI